ncbi:DUF6868 family protein [Aeromonas encheleia]|uniref:DUF6868 family protein n=1 Tax=Aeromonas encheleia TaxID=73010 RepID=UPI0035135215
MDLHTLKAFLLGCLVINYLILLGWFAAFVFAHGWMYRLHSRWFHLSEERFDAIHYLGVAVYKIGAPGFPPPAARCTRSRCESANHRRGNAGETRGAPYHRPHWQNQSG